jgi:hypothetical protein
MLATPLRGRAAIAALALVIALPAGASSLRYFGGASSGDNDRVKIQLDAPETPIDVGATDFTVEFFMRTATGNNASVGCNQNGWTQGNIIIDRDRFGNSRDFGVSMGDGRIAFGVTGTNVNDQDTLCGARLVNDGQWHHVAVQRRRSDGQLFIYVDGQLDAQMNGPDGDISYPNGATPVSGCGSQQSQPCTNDPYFVIAAEKHDLALGFSGWVDELRVSTVLRYSADFTPPTAPFDAATPSTAALYHFDEGSGSTIVDANGNLSPGEVRFNSGMTRPAWSTETPFTSGPGVVQFALASDSIAESGGTRNLQVTRTGGSSGAASVNYQITGGSATSGADYNATSTGTLNWANGDAAAKTIAVTVLDDADPEPSETVTLTLSSPSGASLGARTSTTLTITDNDSPGTLQFSASTASVGEAAGTITITVSRAGGSAGAASVQYQTANGTATASADYTAANGTLNWADGDGTSKSFTVTVLNDTTDEPNETFTVSLSNATGATVATPSTITVTITDDDPPPAAGSLQFSASTYSITEAGGSATISVTRSGGSAGAVSVQYQTANGTATAPADYTASSGTLSWIDGETASKTFTVPIANDTAAESSETVNLSLSSPAGGATLGSPSAAVLTITDDDPPPTGTLQFTSNAFPVGEGTASVSITVSRAGGSAGAASVTIQLAAGGTATSGTDFTLPTSRTLNWADGVTGNQSLTISIQDDALVEGAETVLLDLVSATGATLGTPARTTLTINDNDVAPAGSLQFTAAAVSAQESVGSQTILVSRTGGSSGAVSVQYQTANGTATAPSDFATTSGTLTWAAGDTAQKTIAIPIVNDSAVEGAETFSVTLSNPTGGATIGAPTTATITINDDDVARPGTLALDPASYSISEGGGAVNITVTRTNGSDGAVAVTISSRDISALNGQDYTATSRVLSWASGDSTPKSASVPILDDSGVESNESFEVTLGGPTGGATIGAAVATVTISDNDTAPPPPPPPPPPTSGGDAGGGGRLDLLTLLASFVAMSAALRRRRSIPAPCGAAPRFRRSGP